MKKNEYQNPNYKKIYQIFKACDGNITKFLTEVERENCAEKEMILLKMGSLHMKENEKMVMIIKYALQLLESQCEEIEIKYAFQCALGYEKIKDYLS